MSTLGEIADFQTSLFPPQEERRVPNAGEQYGLGQQQIREDAVSTPNEGLPGPEDVPGEAQAGGDLSHRRVVKQWIAYPHLRIGEAVQIGHFPIHFRRNRSPLPTQPEIHSDSP